MFKDLIVYLSWIFKYLKNEGKRLIFDRDNKYIRSTGPRRYRTETVSDGIGAHMYRRTNVSVYTVREETADRRQVPP